MSDEDLELGVEPAGHYSGADDDTPCAVVGVDREAPVADDTRTTFRASSSREDRHLSTIDQDSWRLANYRRNPVILLNHDRGGLVIGRGAEVKIAERGTDGAHLRIGVVWDTASPQGALVAGQFARGFMHAGSVGFRPDKVTERSKLPSDHKAFRAPKESDSPWWPALHYERAELLEFSAVTVPSNVDAEALRSWGARQVSPLAEIRAAAAEVEDPDERNRRILREILASDGVALVLDAIRSSPVHRAALLELTYGAPRRSTPTPVQSFDDWWSAR